MTLNSRHLRVLVDMPKKRILADLTKVLAERDQLCGCELLIRKRDDFVLQPLRANLCHQIIGQRLIQPHAGDGCPAARARGINCQAHRAAPISGATSSSLDVNGMVPPGQVRIGPQIELVGPGRTMLLGKMVIGLRDLLRQKQAVLVFALGFSQSFKTLGT